MFVEKGFNAAVLNEIAEKAEFSKGAIYGDFKNKDDLFISLIEEELDRPSQITGSVVASSLSPIDKIKKLVQIVLSYFEDNKDFCIFTPEQGRFTKKKYPGAVKKNHPEVSEEYRAESGLLNGTLK